MSTVSIFNDVIGPVMRGPSSSHCAAALRIGRLARDLMEGEIAEVLVEFDRAGSLPTTHESQGSDMGLFGGLLGWDADDERLIIERNRLSLAPLVIGVVSRAAPHVKIPEWEQVLSAGAVCLNLVVAAHAMGFAASWLTQWYAYDRRFLDRLGLGANEKMAGFVHVGRSSCVPEDRTRPVLSSITSYFKG